MEKYPPVSHVSVLCIPGFLADFVGGTWQSTRWFLFENRGEEGKKSIQLISIDILFLISWIITFHFLFFVWNKRELTNALHCTFSLDFAIFLYLLWLGKEGGQPILQISVSLWGITMDMFEVTGEATLHFSRLFSILKYFLRRGVQQKMKTLIDGLKGKFHVWVY